MLSAILSFLGGNLMRAIWGELSHWITEWQTQKHEIERLRLTSELEASQHIRSMESIRLQAELGVKTINVQSEADIGKIEAEGWADVVRATGKAIGVAWVDAWNAVIRPGVATWAIVMLTANEFGLFKISEMTSSVCFAALGIYLADRSLGKRGK